MVLFLLAIACGLSSTAVSFQQVGKIYNDHLRAVERGSNVWRIQSVEAIDTQVCEELGQVDGIKAAGSIQARAGMSVREIANAKVNVLFASPGLISIIWGLSPSMPTSAGVGAALSRELGIGNNSRLTLSQVGDRQHVQTTVILGRVFSKTYRLKDGDRLLAIPSTSSRRTHECLVEAEPGASSAVETLLMTQFPTRATITKLHNSASPAASPTEELRHRSSILISAFSALLLLVFIVLTQLARRADWALYQLLGLSREQQLTMHTLESLALVWAPFSIGVMLAILSKSFFDFPLTEGAIIAVWGDATRAGLVLSALPAILFFALRRRKSVAWLKGE